MLSVYGTTEYVYAEELDTTTDNTETDKKEEYSNKLVITDNNGNEQPIVKKVIRPQVTGVIIACKGGGNIVLEE